MTVKAGIYKVVNLLNNKIYVGSSINLKSRKYNHFNQLQRNIHKNTHLQNSYNKYGEANFIFEIIEYINRTEDTDRLKNELLEREQFYIDTLNPDYNICKIATNSTLGVKHKKEFGEQISKRMKGNKYGVGHKVSDKHKEATRERSIGNFYCKGRKMSETNKEKIVKNLGKLAEKRPVINLTTGEVFNSMKEAGEFYNIPNTGIWRVCNGKHSKSGGYSWAYIS